jgi:hypothetical protein
MKLTLRTIRSVLGVTGANLALAGCGHAVDTMDGAEAADSGARPASGGQPAPPPPARPPSAVPTPDPTLPISSNDPESAPELWPDALPPFPLEMLVCPDQASDLDADAGWQPIPGFHGSCCVHALCYTPRAGSPCASKENARGLPSDWPPGSGTCECGVSGPYASPPSPAEPAGSDCCYAVGVIGCDGRPLSTPDGPLLAPVVTRTEWIV